MHFERLLPFKMHEIIFFFPENLKKSKFHQLINLGSDYPKHRYFLIWPKANGPNFLTKVLFILFT